MLRKLAGRILRKSDAVPAPFVQTTPATPPAGTISHAEYLERCACDDYHGARLTNFRVERTLLYVARGIPEIPEPGFLMLAAAIAMFRRPVRILEFGGGTGWHLATLRMLMPETISRYVIVETPEQARAAEGRISDVEFVDHVPSVSFDIVFSSGALQCTQGPLGYLAQLCKINAPVMVFARNAFSNHQIYFEQKSSILDHGAGPVPAGYEGLTTTLYVQSINEQQFLDVIPAAYRAVARSPNNTGAVDGTTGHDYLFRLVGPSQILPGGCL